MRNLTCFIVDDNQHAIDTIYKYIGQTNGLQCLGISTSSTDFLKKLQEGLSPDLVFINIEMPVINGLELSALLPDNVLVIFVSGYPRYAAKAFDVDAVDFLKKPINYARFYRALTKAFKRMTSEKHPYVHLNYRDNYLSDLPRALFNPLAPMATKWGRTYADDLFFVFSKESGRADMRRYSELLYVEGLDKYVQLYFIRDRQNIFHRSLTSTEKILPSYFIRIHRSYIINTIFIKSISTREVLLEFVDRSIPVGETYKQNLSDFMEGRILKNEY